MPKIKRSLSRHALVILGLTILINLFCRIFFVEEVEGMRLPATTEAMLVTVQIDWDAVPEDDRPDSVEFTMVPDGIAFMATNIYLDSALDWTNQIEVHLGTRNIQFKGVEIEGFDHRILGQVKEGFTIEYYPLGQVPSDDAELADQGISTESIVLEPVPSQTVLIGTAGIQIETSEGESLSEEEIRERLIEQRLTEEGYIIDKTPYYIGIAVCVALIIIVIVIRILLGRN